LNLHRHQVLSADSVIDIVRKSRTPIEIDIDDEYERRIKTLYSAILDFTTRAGDKRLPPETADRVYALREIATDIVKSVKSVKHLRKNVLAYTTRPRGTVTELYDNLRAEIARVVIEIHKLGLAAPEDRSALWLDQERAQIEEGARSTSTRVESLIRAGDLTPYAATSFLNDSGYAYGAMRDLIAAARNYYIERDSAMAEVERLLSLDDEELGESLAQNGADSPSEASGATGHKTIINEAHHAQAVLDKGDV
jgi:phosphate:Na+ symporter